MSIPHDPINMILSTYMGNKFWSNRYRQRNREGKMINPPPPPPPKKIRVDTHRLNIKVADSSLPEIYKEQNDLVSACNVLSRTQEMPFKKFYILKFSEGACHRSPKICLPHHPLSQIKPSRSFAVDTKFPKRSSRKVCVAIGFQLECFWVGFNCVP